MKRDYLEAKIYSWRDKNISHVYLWVLVTFPRFQVLRTAYVTSSLIVDSCQARFLFLKRDQKRWELRLTPSRKYVSYPILIRKFHPQKSSYSEQFWFCYQDIISLWKSLYSLQNIFTSPRKSKSILKVVILLQWPFQW